MISDIQELKRSQKTLAVEKEWQERHPLLKSFAAILFHVITVQCRRNKCIIQMCTVLHGVTTNKLNIQFVLRPRFRMVRRSASAANQSIYERSFAAMNPKL